MGSSHGPATPFLSPPVFATSGRLCNTPYGLCNKAAWARLGDQPLVGKLTASPLKFSQCSFDFCRLDI